MFHTLELKEPLIPDPSSTRPGFVEPNSVQLKRCNMWMFKVSLYNFFYLCPRLIHRSMITSMTMLPIWPVIEHWPSLIPSFETVAISWNGTWMSEMMKYIKQKLQNALWSLQILLRFLFPYFLISFLLESVIWVKRNKWCWTKSGCQRNILTLSLSEYFFYFFLSLSLLFPIEKWTEVLQMDKCIFTWSWHCPFNSSMFILPSSSFFLLLLCETV